MLHKLTIAFLTLALALTSISSYAVDAEALPLEIGPTGVLFRVHSPDAREVYVAGTFNGWAGSDGIIVTDVRDKMYGPDNRGVFEKFYPLAPGFHTFKYAVDGYQWIPGPPDLPRAKDDFDLLEGQNGMAGSRFEFSLTEPPWPSYVSTADMLPSVVIHKEQNKPYLRVRFFSRQAQTAHVVGSWDGWSGISNRQVNEGWYEMQPANAPHFYEKYIGPLEQGILEYKIVVNNRQWLSDPTVLEQSDDGNTRMQIVNHQGNWLALYTPRFDPKARRKATANRWGDQLVWLDDRDQGFTRAKVAGSKMLWVITLPQSKLSVDLMTGVNSDSEMVGWLQESICLETAAHDVEDILRDQRIFRLPHVVIVDSNYKPVFSEFNPSLGKIKEAWQAAQ